VVNARPGGSLWGPLLILSLWTSSLVVFGVWLQVTSGYHSYQYNTGRLAIGTVGLLAVWWALRCEGSNFRGCVGRLRVRDLGWALLAGAAMSAIWLGIWSLAGRWLATDNRQEPPSDFFPFSPRLLSGVLIESVWITFTTAVVLLGYVLPRLRDRVGPVWAVVIVALCSGAVQASFEPVHLPHVAVSMLLGTLVAIPPALITFSAGSIWPGFLGWLLMVQLQQLDEVLLSLIFVFFVPALWVPPLVVGGAVLCCYRAAKTRD
jgi:membrane protein